MFVIICDLGGVNSLTTTVGTGLKLAAQSLSLRANVFIVSMCKPNYFGLFKFIGLDSTRICASFS